MTDKVYLLYITTLDDGVDDTKVVPFVDSHSADYYRACIKADFLKIARPVDMNDTPRIHEIDELYGEECDNDRYEHGWPLFNWFNEEVQSGVAPGENEYGPDDDDDDDDNRDEEEDEDEDEDYG